MNFIQNCSPPSMLANENAYGLNPLAAYFQNKPICFEINRETAAFFFDKLQAFYGKEPCLSSAASLSEKCIEVLSGREMAFLVESMGQCDPERDARSFCKQPTPFDPYSGYGVKNLSPLNETPDYALGFVRPGIYFSPSKSSRYETIGYEFSKPNLQNHKKTLKTAEQIRHQILRDPEQKSQVFLEKYTNSNGMGVQYESDIFLFNINPKLTNNYRDAMKELRGWIGKTETLSEEEILQNLLHLHAALGKDLGIHPLGNYRTQEILVFLANEEPSSREELIAIIKKRGLSVSEQKLALLCLTKKPKPEEEKKCEEVVSKVAFAPPDPDKIPALMKEFAHEWKQSVLQMKKCGGIDPVALGAYIHNRIGAVHPFSDGNGRLSRLLLNALLMEGGYDPAIFPSDSEYTEAIEKDAKEPGSFARYLAKSVIPWTQKQKQYVV